MNTITAAEPVQPKRPKGGPASIPPRRVDFDFSPAQVPRYYVDNNPFKTTFITALSALFPEGEFFFVESVRHYREQITDPVLRAQVSGFIGQEALHSLAHKAFNDAATVQGFSVDKLDRDVGLLLRFLRRVLPHKVQLAVTACLEHYTAVFTEQLLRDEPLAETFAPEIRHLYLWHSVEENEHKTVAFDVYEAIGGGYLLRAFVMIPTTLIFFGMIFWFHTRLLADDRQLRNIRQNIAGFTYIFGHKGVLSGLLSQYLDWFRPEFHPSHHNTDALLAEWQEKLFGAGGMLTDKLRKPGRQKAH